MSAPTRYDELQNRWIIGLGFVWVVSIVVAILATAEVFSGTLRGEINELRERIATLERIDDAKTK